MTEEILQWDTCKRKTLGRHEDWFWALGIFVFFGIIISLIFANILLAIIIGLTGFIVFVHEKKVPLEENSLHVKIDKRGVQLGKELFTYEKIASFWIEEGEPETGPCLIIHYQRLFVPNITIPIIGQEPEKVRQLLLLYGEEEKHVKTLTEAIFDALGF